jgi:hypothetical protein
VLFSVLLVASLSACESPLSPSELLALSEAEARWARRSFQDYAFEIRRSCFCEPLVTQWAHVEVLGGVVSRVVLLETGAEVSSQERGRFPTVEGIFARIRAAAKDESLADIKVEFDPVLGYPTRVTFAAKPDILDGGSATYLRSVSSMP